MDKLTELIISNLIGLVIGLATSFFSWWILYHKIVPTVQFADFISKVPRKSGEGYRYRFKLKNTGRRGMIDVEIVVRLVVDWDGSNNWTAFYIPLARQGELKYEIPKIGQGFNRVLALFPNEVPDFRSNDRLTEEFRAKAIAQQLTLEDVLALGKEAKFRIYVSGYDEFSGARKLLESKYFTKEDIREGWFKGLAFSEKAPSISNSEEPNVDDVSQSGRRLAFEPSDHTASNTILSSIPMSMRSIIIATMIVALAGIPAVIWIWQPRFIILGLASILIGSGLALWFVPRWQAAANRALGIEGKDVAELEDAYRRTLTQIFGGAAVIIGILFTWNNLVISQRTLEQSERRAAAEMFSRATEQLSATHPDGSPRIESRLGGIYTLKQIAKSNPEYFWPIASLFNAYLRSTPSLAHSQARTSPANPSVREDVVAVFEALGDENFSTPIEGGKSLPVVIAPGIMLQGCLLGGLHFTQSKFPQADFSLCRFEGTAFVYTDLHSANFDGVIADANPFVGHSNLGFTFVNLSGASFHNAKLAGAAFSSSTMVGADFEGADLGSTEFSYVDLSGTKGLTCEQIKAAKLTETKLPTPLKYCMFAILSAK